MGSSDFPIGPTEFSLVAQICRAAGHPLILKGPPGVGKSSSVRAYVRALGHEMAVVLASIREPSDFAGLPVVASNGEEGARVNLAPPGWVFDLARWARTGGAVLFLDEVNLAAPATQGALLRVVLERVVVSGPRATLAVSDLSGDVSLVECLQLGGESLIEVRRTPAGGSPSNVILDHVTLRQTVSLVRMPRGVPVGGLDIELRGCVLALVESGALCRIPTVHTLHGVPSRRPRRRDRVERMLCRSTGRVLAVSDAVASWAVAEVGMPAGCVRVLRNGVDPAQFDVHPSPPPRNGTPLVVGSVGRLHRDKGHDILLESASMLARHRHDVEVVLVGDGPERDALEQFARSLDVRVRFLGAQMDVASFLARMHLFVLPSRREGLGIALLEAMACRLPCVASDLPALREVLTDGNRGQIAGRLFPTGDATALGHQLLELSRDAEACVQMGERARRRILEAFDESRWARQLECIYEELLDAHSLNRLVEAAP